MPLPFDIITNDRMNKMVIPLEGIVVESVLPPQVDAKGFYLKKVTLQ